MPPVRTTALACLLASLCLLAPIAASASPAGGTAQRDSTSFERSRSHGNDWRPGRGRHRHSQTCGHQKPQEHPVPEPGALLVFSAGALVIGAALRSRKRR